MGNFKHGMEGTPTYQAWRDMKRRCLCETSANFHNYGGRGIKVCDRWMTFQNFYADMGERPPGFSLERVDVNGNYEPGNCKWIPLHEQKRNRRSTLRVEVNGTGMTMKEACMLLGVNYRTAQSRINLLGWTKEEALGLCLKTTQRPGPVSEHSQREAA